MKRQLQLGGIRRSTSRGFTLIELSFVMLMMGMMLLVALPNLARTIKSEIDFYSKLSLWTEIILERSGFRREIILLEIDPKEGVIKAVQPIEVLNPYEEGETDNSFEEDENDDAAVSLQEIDDPYFPSTIELPEGFEIEDVQSSDGEKFREDKYYLVFYPYGWVDPLTIHLRNSDREEFTGFINSVTGRIAWKDGYSERIYEESEEY